MHPCVFSGLRRVGPSLCLMRGFPLHYICYAAATGVWQWVTIHFPSWIIVAFLPIRTTCWELLAVQESVENGVPLIRGPIKPTWVTCLYVKVGAGKGIQDNFLETLNCYKRHTNKLGFPYGCSVRLIFFIEHVVDILTLGRLDCGSLSICSFLIGWITYSFFLSWQY